MAELDPTDDRIRTLLAQAVASAPPPPTVDDVQASSLRVVPVDVAPPSRPALLPSSDPARTLRLAAACAVVLVLVVAGAWAIGGQGDADYRAVMPGDALPVRYVPTDVPSGLVLTDVELAAAPDPDPIPDVSVYERDDGVRVRIAAGPAGWAARTAGPTVNGTLPETTTSASPVSTSPATTATAAGPGVSTLPGSTSTTTGPTTTTTTTGSASGTASPNMPGVPHRPDLRATNVRGEIGGLEAHDATTSTVWFEHEDKLVAVDVYGLDQAGALGMVERLAPDVDGHLVPSAEDALRRVARTPSRPAGATPPAMAQLVYTDAGGGAGGPAFVVTTVRLAEANDEGADLLAGAWRSFGRLERWGDRQVLVDDGLDDGATTVVSFVDPAGVLVTVLGPTGELAPYVDGLVPADERLWDQVVTG